MKKESLKAKKARAAEIVAALEELYPSAECALEYNGDPWRLLVMARLSAQCTDARVNIVSKELFCQFPTLEAVADADLSALEEAVRPCGLYKTKAKSIKETAAILVRDYGGEVPHTMDELLALPGVGRKTANLILGDIYNTPGSVVADTHCIRICGRLGLSHGKDPVKVEQQLRTILPPEESSDFCHRIVLFGRDCCTARSPKCAQCPLSMFCTEFIPLDVTSK